MTKRNTSALAALALLLALFAVSCSPAPGRETVARLPLEGDSRKIEVNSSFDNKMTVSFPPVSGATGYEVTVKESGGTQERTVRVDKTRNWKDGLLSVEVKGLRPDTVYDVTVRVHGKTDEDTIEMKSGGWATQPSTGDIDSRKPIAYLEGIKKDPSDPEGTFSADITIDRNKDLLYRIAVIPEPDSLDPADAPFFIDVEQGRGTITVNTGDVKLTPKAVIRVNHGKKSHDGIVWGKDPAVIRFPENMAMYDGNLKLFVDESGNFSWTGADPAKGAVTLYRYTAAGGTEWSHTVPSAEAEGTFGKWRDGHSLESALFFITDGKTVSNPVFHTSGPAVTVETTQQSVTLKWKEPEGADIAYSGIAEPELIDGWMVSTERGLESLTDYTYDLTAIFSDGREAHETITARTDSFAGKYRWQDTVSGPAKNAGNFIVNVYEAPENSAYKYHIYTDPADQKCLDDDDTDLYRLMPLFDEGLGEEIPKEETQFKDRSTEAAKAYAWNESKWNSSTLHPNSWVVVAGSADGDSTVSKVRTKAMLGVQVVTQTDVEFFVTEEGKPMMRFRNKAVEGKMISLVNGNLNINHVPRAELGEDEFTYALEYIGTPRER